LAKTLRQMYPGETEVYAGMAADKALFLEKIAPKLERYGKVVFATHGYFGRGLQGTSDPVLVLTLVPQGKDGLLLMPEVMGLRMNADIVALTACQSGLGRELPGEGMLGMGWAFEYAGARTILMSLWSVAEPSSVLLAERFFAHLKEGKSKLFALKAARQDVRKAGYQHPFFWASFVLVGEPK
jgi:CHAT domain-containing protein